MDRFETFFDWFMEKIFLRFFMTLMVLTFLMVPIGLFIWFLDSQSPTFSLRKDEWSCTLEHEYTTSTMVMVGKVIVPQMMTHHDCIRWEHR